MKLTKVEYNTISQHYKRTKLAPFIDEFIEMNTQAVEIVGYTHKTASSCATAFNIALKGSNHNYIKARVIQGKPYLLNMSLIDKEV